MKILNKLTLKNLRLNRSRTVVTVIGIMLSTALMTVVAGIATSAQQTMINAQIFSAGNWTIQITDFKAADIETLKSNRSVKSLYVKDELGCAYLPGAKNEKRPYINITALSKGALEDCFPLPLSQGRYPQNDSELVLSKDILNNSDKNFKVGDTISLEIGKRYDSYSNPLPDMEEYLRTFGESGEDYYVGDGPETLRLRSKRKYKIVGILDETINSRIVADKSLAVCTAITCCDFKKLTADSALYVQFLPEGEKNYIHTISGLTGLTDNEVETYLGHNAQEYDKLSEKSRYQFETNKYLLQYKGYGNSDETMTMLYSLAAIIIAIVVVASIFVIRNSFAISITEKTRLYGMLASVGATSKQICRNVLFEGFVLGLIGIPLGLLLGIGVAAVLVLILNLLLGDMLNGVSIVYFVPVLVAVIAAALSALTILLSAVSSAVRASRVSPITAIRSNADIKLSKKTKRYKSPKYVKRLFGIGGDIAYKNLKRSRKKYRTTVISITVSVALFVAMASFVEYAFKFTSQYYSEIEYNVLASVNSAEGKKMMNEIKSLDGVEKSVLTGRSLAFFSVNSGKLTDRAKKYFDEPAKGDNYCIDLDVCSVDDDIYRRLAADCGLSYDEALNKGIFYNRILYMKDGKNYYANIFEQKSGYTLKALSENSGRFAFKTEIAASFDKLPEELEDIGVYYGTIIVSENWYENNIPSRDKGYILSIKTEEADALEADINNLGYYDVYVQNNDSIARQMNTMTLIFEIFIYGFIIVISLIGVTNIFNTITTNMKLRGKEFAMLKSVGMTKSEFNRMIRLESLFYGARSLVIGIPLGLFGGFSIYYAFNQNMPCDYAVPWAAVLISIVFVFALVWLIMKFSVRSGNRQNIIETIRNDNI